MINLKSRANVVHLCSTPLDKDNNNQLTFTDKSTQANYFISNTSVKVFNGLSYIREPIEGENRGYISVPEPVWKLHNCNYVVYKNSDDSKYYYCFIDKMKYVNEMTTHLFITIDSFQTWQFDLEYKQSFIDRQTPLEDNYNTLADNVAHGQLIAKDFKNFEMNKGGFFVFCSSNVMYDDLEGSQSYSFKMGLYSAPCFTMFWNKHEAEKMSECLQKIALTGRGDRILSCVYIPFINTDDVVFTKVEEGDTQGIGEINIVTKIMSSNSTISYELPEISEFKKARTYPYSKLVVRDHATGQTIELAPEKFHVNPIQFQIRTTVSESPYYKIIPMYYEGQQYAYEHALVVKCDTSLPVANNLYAKYLMQNGEANAQRRENAIVNMGMSVASSIKNKDAMGIVGSGINAYQELANITIQENQASKLGNSLTSIKDDAQMRLNFPDGINIALYTMDENHMEMAENYWKMVGYPVKSLGVPNIKGNKYNYVKLAVPNILGKKVPQDDMDKIRNMFYKGVTLWHNPNDFLNY